MEPPETSPGAGNPWFSLARRRCRTMYQRSANKHSRLIGRKLVIRTDAVPIAERKTTIGQSEGQAGAAARSG